MIRYYVDAGTTWSKILELSDDTSDSVIGKMTEYSSVESNLNKKLYLVPSKKLGSLGIKFERATGHMAKSMLNENGSYENEILALAYGAQNLIDDWHNSTVIDLGSRDSKWIRFENGKYKDLDWNGSCGSATGATIEMLCKFYDVNPSEIPVHKEKYPVTCGVFAMEKIMDDISAGKEPQEAVAKYIHGIAYNTWNFAQRPSKIHLSGGFCENKCFVDSLKLYSEVELLGRYVLLKGLSE